MDAAGNVYLGGVCDDRLDFGDGERTGGGGYLAKLDPTGQVLWTRQLATQDVAASYAVPDAFRADGAGNVHVAGSLVGTVAFEAFGAGETWTSAGGFDLFVLQLGPSGELVWSTLVGDTFDEYAGGLDLDAAGDVLVGLYGGGGAVDFGGGPVETDGADVVVGRLTSAGAHVSTVAYVSAADQFLGSVAVDPVGDVVIAGGFAGSVDFGAGPHTSSGGLDVFVAKLCP
ncbi:MAG: hypothetical protein IT373_35265 [Polyangiaceae bacterium]|nr:hypothetical protein [Polyangiaceae bacterium]